MAKQLFVNLPVKDLPRSVAFFSDLGFTFNPSFTDENATCMIVNDHACVMLLVEKYFRSFITKDVASTVTGAETIVSYSVDSREEVDRAASTALTSGGAPSGEALDHGFMYTRSFQDPDGHLWEVFWMDPAGPSAEPLGEAPGQGSAERAEA